MAWMLGPRSLTRHKVVLDLVAKAKPERILEVGFGNGELLKKLDNNGFQGKGLDFSCKACEAFDYPLTNFVIQHGTTSDLEIAGEKYSMLLSCEVLEHIKDDVGTLKSWNKLIENDGCLLISVPAHMSKWGHNDDYAGHLRRYEKKEITQKLLEAGFEVRRLYSYGYPLINLVKFVGDKLSKNKVKDELSALERTKESGVHTVNKKYTNLISSWDSYPQFYCD